MCWGYYKCYFHLGMLGCLVALLALITLAALHWLPLEVPGSGALAVLGQVFGYIGCICYLGCTVLVPLEMSLEMLACVRQLGWHPPR